MIAAGQDPQGGFFLAPLLLAYIVKGRIPVNRHPPASSATTNAKKGDNGEDETGQASKK